MTEVQASTKQALQKLNEQLTCAVCLEPYTDPKLLQCFHVFCENCLKPRVAHDNPQGQVVECPNCRQLTSLPQNGVPGLQGAVVLHHLLHARDILKRGSAPSETKCDKCGKREPSCFCQTCGFVCEVCEQVHTEWKELFSHKIISLKSLTEDSSNVVLPVKKPLQCSNHPGSELDLYCETCEVMICRDCILKVHHDHQYDVLEDAFPKHKDEIVAALQPVEQQLASVDKALEGLDTRCGQITDQRQTIETDIKRRFHQLHKALAARQEELTTQLDEMAQQKLKSLATQRDELELAATRLKTCLDCMQDGLKNGSQGEILTIEKPFVQQIKKVTAKLAPKALAPCELADLRFTSSQNQTLQAYQQFGAIASQQVCPATCHAEGSGVLVAAVGEISKATVNIVDQNGKEYKLPAELSCELVSSDGSSRVNGGVERVKENKYEISYRPQRGGRHLLHIRVDEKEIAKSPFSVAVITNIPTVIKGLQHPSLLTTNDQGQIIVAEYSGHCVSLLSNEGKKIRSFGCHGSGPGELDGPYGVVLTSRGEYLVCDYNNSRLQLFSAEGEALKCIGTRGSGPLQFCGPLCSGVHPHSNNVYVTDNGNSRVQILAPDFTFLAAFGSVGSGKGQFDNVCGVGFDSTGNVYITERGNHRVQVFTAVGEYIRQFGKEGNREGELSEPVGIAIDSSGVVYVSEWDNHRISLFTQDGHFLRWLGTQGEGMGQFSYPSGVTVSNEGRLYVCDQYNGRIQLF